jgi:hypothetical protein
MYKGIKMKQDASHRQSNFFLLAAVAAVAGMLLWFNSRIVETETKTFSYATEPASKVSTALPENKAGDSDLAALRQRLDDLTAAVKRTQAQLEKHDQALVEDSNDYQALPTQSMSTFKPYEEADIEQEDVDIQQEQDRAQAEQFYEDQLVLLESDLAAQTVDQQWLAQVEYDFHNAFEERFQNYSLDNISCGSTMCKLKATMHLDDESTELGMPPGIDHIIHGDIGWPGQSIYAMNAETGEVTVYLMREGAEMPYVENGF